jgi:hypothetical protein
MAVLVFLSYARADKQLVRPLVEGLRMLGHEVWIDEDLTGGTAWWNLILESLRNADAIVAAVSERALDSQACVRERSYASALGKPILPVVVEAVIPDLLPPELALLHFVQYETPDASAALRLAAAMAKIQPLPLPEVLPPPPPPPFSSLSELSQRVRAESLNLDEQYALVARLRAALQRSEDRVAAAAILQRLERRHDLFAAIAREIAELHPLLADLITTPRPKSEAAVLPPAVVTSTQAAEHKVNAAAERIGSLILAHSPISRLSIAPDIPRKYGSKVTKAFALETGEPILGVFDLTQFKTGGIFLALTDRRILYKNGDDKLSIPYQDISPDQISESTAGRLLMFDRDHYWNWPPLPEAVALLKAVAEAAKSHNEIRPG